MVDEVLGDPEERSEQDEPAGVAFSLEYQLRDFIAQNLSALEIGESQLRLYVDPTGRDGVEYPTAVGPIDILAIDESGAFVVFELKRASSPDHAIGQVARYMGWVKHTIGRERRVRGVIVGRKITEKLKYAASIIPDVEVFEYEVQFHFRAANAVSPPGQ